MNSTYKPPPLSTLMNSRRSSSTSPFRGFTPDPQDGKTQPRRHGAQLSTDPHHVKAHENEEFRGSPKTTWRPTTEETLHQVSLITSHIWNEIKKSEKSSIPAPMFRGLDHESPKLFLQNLEEYLISSNIPRNKWLFNIESLLDGDTKLWFGRFHCHELSFTAFCKRFLDNFDNPSLRSKLYASLYGRKQISEPIAQFVTEKQNLFLRLEPDLPETSVISRIIELVKPDLRIHLRGKCFKNIDEFIQVVNVIERDLTDLNQITTTNQIKQQNQPRTPCRHCGNWHFHKDCPKLKQQPEN